MTPMQRAWTFAGCVAALGLMMALVACANTSEEQAIRWANTSHALQCEMGGLC